MNEVDLPFDLLAARLRAADLPDPAEVDAVVAIGRGGTVPGALVAFHMDRPLRLLRLSFRDDDNTPARPAPEPVGVVPDVRGQHVVLVDDVAVTGSSLRHARDLLGAAQVTTVVFKGRPGSADVVLVPDVPSCVRWPWKEDVPPATIVAHGPGIRTAPRAIVVAGVSGSGKTTVARALAERLGWTFLEGDDFHPPENVAKMRGGTPLTDEDRVPWLAALRTAMDEALAAGHGVVMACSALKARYREILGCGRPEVAVVLLDAPRERVAGFLRNREGHFFEPSLLDSQYRDLERPDPAETVLVTSVDAPPAVLVRRILEALRPLP